MGETCFIATTESVSTDASLCSDGIDPVAGIIASCHLDETDKPFGIDPSPPRNQFRGYAESRLLKQTPTD